MFDGEKREPLRKRRAWNEIGIIETEAYPDHSDELPGILQMGIPRTVEYEKWEGGIIYERLGNCKIKDKNLKIWYRQYDGDINQKNTAKRNLNWMGTR